MTSAYFSPLVLLPTIITEPGRYRTRAGEIVTVEEVTMRHIFGCLGHYENGTPESWHRSGRIMASRETENDLIERLNALEG